MTTTSGNWLITNEAAGYVNRWRRECTEDSPSKNKAAQSSSLYRSYVAWAREHDARPLDREPWGFVMQEAGFPAAFIRGRRIRLLVLKEVSPSDHTPGEPV